jgi:hypothetical protein
VYGAQLHQIYHMQWNTYAAGWGSTPRGLTSRCCKFFFPLLLCLAWDVLRLVIGGRKGTWCMVHSCSCYRFGRTVSSRTGFDSLRSHFLFICDRFFFSCSCSRPVLLSNSRLQLIVKSKAGMVVFPRSQS